MPELPEVEITKRGIAQNFSGQCLLACTVRQPRLRWPVPTEVQSCVKQVLRDVQRRSKYILMDFGEHLLVVHLGMSGSMRIVGANTPWDKHDHIEWSFGDRVLRYNDPRRFGSVDCVRKLPGWESRFVRFAKLGPEPFGPLFTPESFYAATRGKKVSVTALLLSGLAVVGVGKSTVDFFGVGGWAGMNGGSLFWG